jgi:hypothetical protein
LNDSLSEFLLGLRGRLGHDHIAELEDIFANGRGSPEGLIEALGAVAAKVAASRGPDAPPPGQDSELALAKRWGTAGGGLGDGCWIAREP